MLDVRIHPFGIFFNVFDESYFVQPNMFCPTSWTKQAADWKTSKLNILEIFWPFFDP